ncbi:MAG: hypothetical protein ABSC94_24340 [Polyangiaceae bacterium]|jgi:hypothetical protein
MSAVQPEGSVFAVSSSKSSQSGSVLHDAPPAEPSPPASAPLLAAAELEPVSAASTPRGVPLAVEPAVELFEEDEPAVDMPAPVLVVDELPVGPERVVWELAHDAASPARETRIVGEKKRRVGCRGSVSIGVP